MPTQLVFGSEVSGHATMYGDGDGNACGFPLPSESEEIFPVAIGGTVFGKGEACGACIEIDPGSNGVKTKAWSE